MASLSPITGNHGRLVIALCACLAARSQNTSEMQRAVQEFKVQTAALGARATPSSRAKTRSGATQMWHGRIFENFRNDLLDAIPHEIRQRGSDKSLLRRSQFGFNVTGPLGFPWLLRPIAKTYLSLSYEGVRERISRTSLNTIPIAGERVGDFSQTVDAAGQMLPIYDPASTSLNPAYDATQAVSTDNLQYLRDPFPREPHSAEPLRPRRGKLTIPLSCAQRRGRPVQSEQLLYQLAGDQRSQRSDWQGGPHAQFPPAVQRGLQLFQRHAGCVEVVR